MYYILYPLLYVLSLLPFRVLYIISNFFSYLAYRVFKYRRAVVEHNLALAFAHKSLQQRNVIAKQFYTNLIDTFMESLKFISISKRALLKRSTGEFDLINDLIAQGKNVHLMACHQFNWEYANLLYALKLTKPFVGVYMPISNKALDAIFYNFRCKYGTILISAADFKSKMHTVFNNQYLLGLAADQNPGNPQYAYWMHFMGQPTPFVTGPAKGAVRNNTAVVMVGFHKVKRGYYHFTTELLTADAAAATPQQITLLYKNALEKIIHQDPANYLWSHRRWKYTYNQAYGPMLD